MKRIIWLLLTITILLSIIASVPLSASAVTTDRVESGYSYTDEYGEWTYNRTADNNGCIITGYNGNMTNIEIPDSIYGIPVLEIGDSVFRNNLNIISVTIPEGVITIGVYVL